MRTKMNAPIIEIYVCMYMLGYSQCCLRDASFGSQYVTHTFRPESEISIGKFAKLILSMDS